MLSLQLSAEGLNNILTTTQKSTQMNVLDLSTQTGIQLELLVAREEKTINAINNILTKIDEVCMEEMGMTLEQLLEVNDYAIDRLNTLKSEIKDRASTL